MARKLATYDDLLAYPEDARTEIFDGEIHVQPSPLPGHSRAQRTLSRFVGGPFDDDRDGPGGWWIFLELDVRFGPHDVVRPDLSGWRRERLPDPWNTRPIDGTWDDSALARVPPFDAVELPVGRLFPPAPPGT